ncbi:MAG: hypothetical protein ACF8SC_07380 [Phycisphaerales bacterium JB037]
MRSLPRTTGPFGRAARLATLAALGGLLAACRSEPNPLVFDAAPRWETVFPGESSAALVGRSDGEGWWTHRRDEVLIGDAGRLPTALTRSNEPLPDLSRARYLYVPRSPEQMLFFPPTERRSPGSYYRWR